MNRRQVLYGGYGARVCDIGREKRTGGCKSERGEADHAAGS